jgi:hypothetical protein
MKKTKKSILIIGNGQSILDYEIGNIIDTFNNIARINNFMINNYEKKTGKKTDIWINGANQKLLGRKQIFSQTIVSIPSSIIIKKSDSLIEHVSKRLKMKATEFSIIPIYDIQRYESSVDHKRLTTGITSILWGLDNFDEVFIHGFDFFIDSKSHYYDSKFYNFINKYILNKGHKHDNLKEQKFVQNLINNGIVKRLIDNI